MVRTFPPLLKMLRMIVARSSRIPLHSKSVNPQTAQKNRRKFGKGGGHVLGLYGMYTLVQGLRILIATQNHVLSLHFKTYYIFYEQSFERSRRHHQFCA